MRRLFFLVFPLTFFVHPVKTSAQDFDNTAIRALIEKCKSDIRGPYKDIRWFCKDGSVLPPKEKCPEQGGVQRARLKDEVAKLAKDKHIFFGQILSTTSRNDFWDAENYNSRLKQYQLEKFLRAADEGWILQKGQYYRGAIQVEDEEAWGVNFFNWLLADTAAISSQFYLLRQAAKDIPHRGDDSRTQNVRALSKIIAENFPAFQDLRIKIHGQPDAGDVQKVKSFALLNGTKMTAGDTERMRELISEMEILYQPVDLTSLEKYVKLLPSNAPVTAAVQDYIARLKDEKPGKRRVTGTADLLLLLRKEMPQVTRIKSRLAMLDLSNVLEEILFKEIGAWQENNLSELLEKSCYLGTALTATGYLELWEWELLEGAVCDARGDSMSLNELNRVMETCRGMVEWGTGTTRGVYQDVVKLYSPFEPLANSFYDDKIRSSLLLPMGQLVGRLGDFIAQEAKLSNRIFDIENQSQARGLNPGIAAGELVVVSGQPDDVEVSKDKIYIFDRPPSDLKPVAGIATVTEGNMVSHVQLLARNLAIPNAVLSRQNLESLKKYSGKKVFMAVSNRGTVVMKSADDMTAEEKKLFEVQKRSEERISVPVEKIDLSRKAVLNMRDVDATSSGRLCGPKAANLGQLKKMFPDNVVEGLVIPFGIFREHMNQTMPGQMVSYWQFLNDVFKNANSKKLIGEPEESVERYVLGELEILREAIKKMTLSPAFIAELEGTFQTVLGKKMGGIPVFLRSDTNMEDLKDFTGAGLNLTLFNVVEKDKILQGIKDVWASPYTERSFKWRQRYLLNPENVFPSILIIPSVDVDYSGVMITKGITTGHPADLTIAFNRGAGGAVDGQAAETYLVSHRGAYVLLSPAREPTYRSLPASGGSQTNFTTFEKAILKGQNIYELRLLAQKVNTIFPKTPGVESKGPFDMELGFKDDKIWLFQIRPFVENKNALSSTYLESISPVIPPLRFVPLSTAL